MAPLGALRLEDHPEIAAAQELVEEIGTLAARACELMRRGTASHPDARRGVLEAAVLFGRRRVGVLNESELRDDLARYFPADPVAHALAIDAFREAGGRLAA